MIKRTKRDKLLIAGGSGIGVGIMGFLNESLRPRGDHVDAVIIIIGVVFLLGGIWLSLKGYRLSPNSS